MIKSWTGDAVSLVESFRSGDYSPVEEVDAVFDTIEHSDLNAFSYIDREDRKSVV